MKTPAANCRRGFGKGGKKELTRERRGQTPFWQTG